MPVLGSVGQSGLKGQAKQKTSQMLAQSQGIRDQKTRDIAEHVAANEILLPTQSIESGGLFEGGLFERL